MRKLILAVLLASVCAAPAAALDFTKPIVGLDGKPMTQCPPEKPACGETLTLSQVATAALTLQPNVQPNDKFKRYQLAQKVYEAKDVSLKAEEIALIKEAVSATMTAIVVGRVFEAIDPTETK